MCPHYRERRPKLASETALNMRFGLRHNPGFESPTPGACAIVSDLPPPGKTEPRLIEGPAGLIEALWSAPQTAANGLAVICHPHPLFGGAMSNKVTYALAAAAQAAGLQALRFNFRGVGRSAGPHDHGRGETDDVLFLVDWLRERVPTGPVVLMGFSFGSWVAQKAAVRRPPAALVSIAPPLAKYLADEPVPARPACPWLVMHGYDDDVVEYEPTRAIVEAYDPPPEEFHRLDGVGHFFHGRLADISDAVAPFLARLPR